MPIFRKRYYFIYRKLKNIGIDAISSRDLRFYKVDITNDYTGSDSIVNVNSVGKVI